MAVALLAACVALAGCQQEVPATASPKKTDSGSAGAAPRAVKLVPAAEATVARTVTATGTLAADEQVVLGTKVVGRLAEITVDLGSLVKQGQPVARIDTKDYQYRLDQAMAALKQARVRLGLPADGDDDRVDLAQTAVVRQAKALLDQAQLNRDRMAQLWERQLIARAELDAAVSAFQVAEGRYQDALEEVQNRQGMLLQRRSEVELARQQIADTVIASPIDGAVVERQASVGQYLAAGRAGGDHRARCIRCGSGCRCRSARPRASAAGQPVRVSVDGDPSVHIRASWRACPRRSPSRTARCSSRRRSRTRAAASARARSPRPRSSSQADERIVTVPATALVTFAGVEKVLTVRDGKSEEVRVTTGRRLGDRIEIVDGPEGGAAGRRSPGQPHRRPGRDGREVGDFQVQKLAEVCIRRPVFATMIVLALVVVGSASYFRLGVDRFPSVELPTVSVRTELPGASVEEMETQVTQKIEEAVNTIQGITELRSLTGPGTSNVIVTFSLSRSVDVAAQDVRDKVANAVRNLPDDILPPTVSKLDNDQAPVMTLARLGRTGVSAS